MNFPKFFNAAALLLIAVSATSLSPLRADVRMPAVFGDHMVLQQGTKLPVWGWADPNEPITVTLGSNTAKATAGADGKWRVDLPPLPTGAPAQTLTVAGKNTLTFQDVLVGDVWICSGQSNMEFGVEGDSRSRDAVAQSDNTNIRLFYVIKTAALTPQDNIGRLPAGPQFELWGKWQVCSPKTLHSVGDWNGFAGVGYYFGRAINQATGHPVGLIQSTWGGTPAQAWTSLGALQANPTLSHLADYITKMTPDQTAQFPIEFADYLDAMTKWNADGGPATDLAAQLAWRDAALKAKAAGQPKPPYPKFTRPRDPGNDGAPTTLFNGMINPLIPFAIKGVIWYQGEANEGDAAEYATLFPVMITDWRAHWGQGDFPFLFVQLANYTNAKDPNSVNWPVLRESQAKALSLPNTGMATAIDIGNPNDIHPRDKLDVGARLALVARHVAYGENLVYAGPTFDSIKVEGNKIRVSYTNIGGGLTLGTPPWTPDGNPLPPPTALTGFEIAGADKNWVPAQAVIDGQTVVVSSDQLAAPVAVRYDWADSPSGNLYNKDGLPAFPFRTEDGK